MGLPEHAFALVVLLLFLVVVSGEDCSYNNCVDCTSNGCTYSSRTNSCFLFSKEDIPSHSVKRDAIGSNTPPPPPPYLFQTKREAMDTYTRPEDCPSACHVGEWSEWSQCSAECGGGVRTHTRIVISPAANGGSLCPSLSKTDECNTHTCPTGCQVGAWSNWSFCSVDCGDGTQVRSRPVTQQSSIGGAPCPETTQERDCHEACPIDCVMTEWTQWGSCTVSCGGGTSTRTRTIATHPSSGGALCPESTASQPCNTHECPVDCLVGPWSEYGACSEPCGGGTQTRTRSITQNPVGAGVSCPTLSDAGNCNTFVCFVDCQVSEWSVWSGCSVRCGDGGTVTRRRTVKVSPIGGGTECPPLSESRGCYAPPCDANCQVGPWSEWSECSTASSCGEGNEERSRVIVSAVVGAGTPCPPLHDSRKCTSRLCSTACTFSDWSQWSECSASCGVASQFRTRQALSDTATPDGCSPLEETQNCDNPPCPQDCVLSEWSTWGACSADCGGGSWERERRILTVPLGGGAPCDSLSESASCNTHSCTTDVDCQLSEWSEWGSCSESCGSNGTRSSSRSVTLQPTGAGLPCDTHLHHEEVCNNGPCPIPECTVGAWSSWSSCSKLCGGGVIVRTRTVRGTPEDGREYCASREESTTCNPEPCVSPTPTPPVKEVVLPASCDHEGVVCEIVGGKVIVSSVGTIEFSDLDVFLNQTLLQGDAFVSGDIVLRTDFDVEGHILFDRDSSVNTIPGVEVVVSGCATFDGDLLIVVEGDAPPQLNLTLFSFSCTDGYFASATVRSSNPSRCFESEPLLTYSPTSLSALLVPRSCPTEGLSSTHTIMITVGVIVSLLIVAAIVFAVSPSLRYKVFSFRTKERSPFMLVADAGPSPYSGGGGVGGDGGGDYQRY